MPTLDETFVSMTCPGCGGTVKKVPRKLVDDGIAFIAIGTDASAFVYTSVLGGYQPGSDELECESCGKAWLSTPGHVQIEGMGGPITIVGDGTVIGNDSSSTVFKTTIDRHTGPLHTGEGDIVVRY